MHLLTAVWLLEQTKEDTAKKIDHLVTVAVPLLCAFVPTAAAAGIKWLQDHDLRRKRAALADDLTKLAKNLADLPQAPESTALQQMKSALNLEMELGVRELASLQAHAPRRPVGVSSITLGLRAMFLWWRPRGFAAWVLHLTFYAWLVMILFLTIGISQEAAEKKAQAARQASIPQSAQPASAQPSATAAQPVPQEEPTTATTLVIAYIFMGLPPLLFRHFASAIHRRQCLEKADRAAVIEAGNQAGVAPPAMKAVG